MKTHLIRQCELVSAEFICFIFVDLLSMPSYSDSRRENIYLFLRISKYFEHCSELQDILFLTF